MFTLGPHELIIGLGSNSADALTRLRRARACLRARFKLKRSSALYESDALLPEGAPPEWNRPFLNAACLVETTEADPQALVRILKEIERELGRVEAPRWAPRLIDLDLLAWGRADHRCERVSVPHAGLFERPFALMPALECANVSAPHQWRYLTEDEIPQRTRPAQVGWSELVGILNATPDSFSDGGRLSSLDALESAARRLVADGATVLDLGAESTRPGATPVDVDEEITRLMPAFETLTGLRRELGFKLSLDSRHAATAEWALEHYAPDWLNDVEGFTEPRYEDLAVRSGAELVFMHSLGVPPTPARRLDPAGDPIDELSNWAMARIESLVVKGARAERLIFDPGLGFGKTPAQNIAITRSAERFSALPSRVLFGHSRKRFLDPMNAVAAAERDLETAIVSAGLAKAGVDYLRVHAPAVQARAVRLGTRPG